MHGAPPSYHPEDLLDTRSLAGSFHDGASTNLGGADPLTHNLHKRITRLEEALGRVLLQNEQLLSAVREANGGEGIAGAEGGRKKRTNCCVSISEDESGGYSEMDNCCVSIGRRRSNIERERTLKIWIAGLVGIVGLVAVIVLIVVGSVNGKQPRYADDGR